MKLQLWSIIEQSKNFHILSPTNFVEQLLLLWLICFCLTAVTRWLFWCKSHVIYIKYIVSDDFLVLQHLTWISWPGAWMIFFILCKRQICKRELHFYTHIMHSYVQYISNFSSVAMYTVEEAMHFIRYIYFANIKFILLIFNLTCTQFGFSGI